MNSDHDWGWLGCHEFVVNWGEFMGILHEFLVKLFGKRIFQFDISVKSEIEVAVEITWAVAFSGFLPSL